MDEQTVSLAKSLGWNVSENSDGKYIIKIPGVNKKVLLKKEKSNEWLLVCNEKPQAILKPIEALNFIKEIQNKAEK